MSLIEAEAAVPAEDPFGGRASPIVEDPFGGRASPVLDRQRGPPAGVPSVPEPFGRPEGKPRTVSQATGGRLTRGVAEAAGAAVLTGAALETGPAGMFVAGNVGIGVGSIAFDSLTNLFDFLKIIDAPGPPIGALESTGTAISEQAADAAFAGGFGIAGKVFRAAKPALGTLTGVRTEVSRALRAKADALGLSVGATDVSTGVRGTGVRIVSRVAGMFPFVGGAARGQSQKKGETVVKVFNEILDTMAPTVTAANQLGIDATRAARNTVDGFNIVSGTLYGNYRHLQTQLKNQSVIPTKGVVEVVENLFTKAEGETIILKSFTDDAGNVVPAQQMSQEASDRMLKFVEQLQHLPDTLTFGQMFGQTPRSLMSQFKELVSVTGAAGADVKVLAEVKEAMEFAADDLRFAPGEETALVNSILDARDTANLFFSKGLLQFQKGATSAAGRLTGVKAGFDELFRGMETFTGTTGSTFTRVDRNIFRKGPELAGSLNADEILRVAVNLKSTQAVDDLAALIGRENLGKVGRLHIESAWDAAKIIDQTHLSDDLGEQAVVKGIDWDKFLANTGLGTNLGKIKTSTNEGAERLIELSGVKPQEIRDFVRVASRIQVPADVATFIARRALLGGATSALAGASTAIMIKGSPSTTVLAATLARFGLGGVANPQQLRELTRAFAPDASETFTRAVAGRFFFNTLRHIEELGHDRALREAERPTSENPFAPPPQSSGPVGTVNPRVGF